MGSISHHITPLVVHSLRGGHTHTHANTHAYRHLQTKAILRNQARTGLWLAHAWFNKMENAMWQCQINWCLRFRVTIVQRTSLHISKTASKQLWPVFRLFHYLTAPTYIQILSFSTICITKYHELLMHITSGYKVLLCHDKSYMTIGCCI